MPEEVSTTETAAPEPRKRKAAVHYSRKVAEEICRRVAAGERWTKIAGTDELPTDTVAYKWAQKKPDFREAFTVARRLGVEARADKVLDVAEAATKESVPVDRLHIGALKWHVERETKIYGPRPDEPDDGAGRKLIIVVRRFERAVREDGTPYVQEIRPSGEMIDLG